MSARVLLAGALALAPAAAAAQLSARAAISMVGEWRPSVALAVDARKPLGAEPDLPTGEGPVEANVRPWIAVGRVFAGVTFAHAAGDTPSATGGLEAGLLYRLSPGQRLGVLAVGELRPDAVGAVARYEPLVPVGAQLGWVYLTDAKRHALTGGVDVSLSLLRDLFR
jgi:hypothetical protein